MFKEADKRRFAVEVLKGIGAVTSQANVDMMLKWMEAEDSRSKMQTGSRVPVAIERFNPLNTTQKLGASTSVNDVGVQAYSSFADGVQATIRTLTNGRYAPVINAFKAGSGDWEQLRRTIGESPWGTFKQYAGGESSSGGAAGLSEITKKMVQRGALVDPEVAQLLRDFRGRGLQGPDAEQDLTNALMNTNWAKRTADRAREVIASSLTMDEATYQDEKRIEKNRIKGIASSIGAGELDDVTLENLSINTMLLGWSDEELTNALFGAVSFDSDFIRGQAGAIGQKILKGIRDNGFDMSTGSPEFRNYVKRVIDLGGEFTAAGQAALNDIVGTFRNQAAQLYPQYKNRFQEGANLSDILGPYRQLASNLLEVPMDSIKLQDNLMQKVLQSGESLNAFDFTKMVRQTDAWQYTSNAWDTVLGGLQGILEDMGMKF